MLRVQEEKDRKEAEDQRRKQDDDAKKKKALTNMTHQYGGIQQKVSGILYLQNPPAYSLSYRYW